MDLHLRDRAYLVTGGSSGLGFAAAEALVGEGARVVVSSRRETSAAAAAARLADSAATADSIAWIAADNADAATPERLIATAEDRLGASMVRWSALGAHHLEPSPPPRTTPGAARLRAPFSGRFAWQGSSGRI
jgi:NAD(P)-dependent dehydrogenase (short-subunit alcohol dehydrogenase family)